MKSSRKKETQLENKTKQKQKRMTEQKSKSKTSKKVHIQTTHARNFKFTYLKGSH